MIHRRVWATSRPQPEQRTYPKLTISRGLLIIAWLFLTLLLVACTGTTISTAETSVGPEASNISPASTYTSQPLTVSPVPFTPTQTPTRVPAPTPFKAELVLCAGPEPVSLFDNTPSAGLIRRALSALPFVYRPDYTAETGILAAIPTPVDGTLVRNTDDTLTVTLRYREGLLWSDGTPFSAHDAVLGLTVPLSDSPPDPDILQADIIDDLTVQLILEADAGYPYVPNAPPLPTHILGETIDLETLQTGPHARSGNPVLGAYTLQSWSDGEVVLAANPYARLQPNVPTVRIRFFNDAEAALGEFLGGGCDVLAEGQWSLPEGAAAHAYTIRGPLWEHLDFNTYPSEPGRLAFFADSRVRQAVAYALTTPHLGTWLPPNHWAAATYTPSMSYTFDLVHAVALLEEAGWIDADGDHVREYAGFGGEDACGRPWAIPPGTPFRVTLVTTEGDPRRVATAAQIQADLSNIGIAVTVQTVPSDSFFARSGTLVTRRFDLALYSWVTWPEPGGVNQWLGANIYLHPIALVPVHEWELPERTHEWELPVRNTAQLLAPSNIPSSSNDYQGQNYTGWCDPDSNIALTNATRALDMTERRQYYAAHLARFDVEIPTIPLFWHTQAALAQPYVCGLQPSPVNGLTWNLADWYLDESDACGES